MTNRYGSSDQSASSTYLVDSLLRSETLPALLRFAQSLSASLPVLGEVVTFHLVLDANILQGELRWRLGRRKKPHAHTSLHEAIRAGVLIAYAPKSVEEEILEHVEEIARDTHSSVSDVKKEWKLLRSLIRIYEPLKVPLAISRIIDKDDIPYIATCAQLGLRAVYTNDRHLEAMGAPVVKGRVDRILRDYARNYTVALGIAVGTGSAFALSIELIPLLFRFLKGGSSWIKKQPTGIQLALVGIMLVVAIHPHVRERFCKAWSAIAPKVGKAVSSALMQLLWDFAEAYQLQTANRVALERVAPPQPRRTVLMHVRAVCLMKNRPMTLQQISTGIRVNGYVSRSHHADAYLLRVLRRTPDFEEIRPGVWILISRR